MNKFYTQTLIPAPNIDFKSMWTNAADDTTDTRPRWKRYTAEFPLWDTTITSKLEECGLVPTCIRLFRWIPNTVFPWHVDGDFSKGEVTEFAINWVYEGSGIIQWNSELVLPPPGPINGPNSSLPVVFGSKQGLISDSFEAEELGHGCIVNTVIPHRLVNMTPMHRITGSILFGNTLTYSQAVDQLVKHGLVK